MAWFARIEPELYRLQSSTLRRCVLQPPEAFASYEVRVPSDLRNLLQASLGSAHTVERELGGGGMSRVFVAEETALGCGVVVKALPPETAAGLSLEDFRIHARNPEFRDDRAGYAVTAPDR